LLRVTSVYYGERLNSVTHLLGAVAAAAGLAVLVVMAARQGDAWKLVSFSIYGATLLLLYLFSTLYHSTRGRAKPILAKLDHAAIYLLIAGSYTPFTLVTLRGAWGWTLFGLIWGLAMLGIVVDSLHGNNARRILPIIIYIVMGWLVLIAFQPLTAALPYAAVLWLVAGGLFYTLGIVFYALDKKLRHAHGIWHLFVLAGSASHYLAVLLYVA
jgi:hemolysin III